MADRTGLYVGVGLYLSAIAGIAILSFIRGRRAVEENEGTTKAVVEEHFLASKSFGTILLFLTTFSTIISGYTAYGIPNEAGVGGYIAIRWIIVFVGILAFYIVVAPRFRRLSQERNWQSPNDILADRYNNNTLRHWGALLLCVPQVLYIGVQLISLRSMAQELSNGEIDGDAAVWFLVMFIWGSEVIGGFRSVSLTDAIQSGIMLCVFLAFPFILLAKYGGFAGVNDGNLVAPTCSNAANTPPPGSAGTMCITGTNFGWFNYYPPRGQSDSTDSFETAIGIRLFLDSFECFEPGMRAFFDVLDLDDIATTAGPAYAAAFAANAASDNPGAPFVDAPTFFSTCFNENTTAPGASLLYAIIDDVYEDNALFSSVPLSMVSFGLATSVGFFSPHWSQRVIAAKSDEVVKRSIVLTTGAFLIAALPGILLGITKAALWGPGEAGTAALPLILGDLYDNGDGFEQFFSVVASVAAIAAFMSTADSAAIGVSNVLTVEWFQNWLTPDWSGLRLVIVAKLISLITLVSARTILYDESFDILTALNWQVGFGWAVGPSYVYGLFLPDKYFSSPALLVGMATNLIVLFFVEFFVIADQALPVYIYGGIYGGLVNFVVVLLVNPIIPSSWKDDAGRTGNNAVSDAARKRFGSGEVGTLSHDKITQIMAPVSEPVRSRLGQVALITVVLSIILTVPWYGKDGWDTENTEVIAGLPAWAFIIAIAGGVQFALLELTLWTWGTEEPDAKEIK